ncbi:hypothetical protein MJL33_33235, partial [Salmonella enterica subsp. enterica serovar Kentucky]|nr:hypothetical protein [Salmonella enterica subsp. enterica serovar Kentucky]
TDASSASNASANSGVAGTWGAFSVGVVARANPPTSHWVSSSGAAGSQLSEQKIVFLGAGSAGCGIAEQIIAQTQREGLSEDAAR